MLTGSQAWRASGVIGRPTLASTLIYAVGTLLHTDQAMTHSLRTIVVKQSIVSCPGSGKGEIAAAFSGLTTLTGIVAPLVWGSLFRHFQHGSNALARVLGPGGHYCIAAGGFVLTAAMSRAIPAEELSLDAAGSPAPRRSDETSAKAKPAA